MVELHYRSRTGESTSVECEEGETVLEALERAGLPSASSCRAGVCETCLLRARSGDPGEEAQADLRATWRESGYFLACVALPTTDLEIESIDAPPLVLEAAVVEQRPRGQRWLEIVIEGRPDLAPAATPHGGQWSWIDSTPTARRAVVLGRDPERGTLRFALEGAVEVGETVRYTEPRGDAFFVPAPQSRRLIVATDVTSTAAAIGVIREARAAGSGIPIDLFWPEEPGADSDRAEWSGDLDCDEVSVHRAAHPLDPNTILERRPDLRATTVIVCGREGTLKALRAPLFRSGASPTRVLRVVYPDPPPTDTLPPDTLPPNTLPPDTLPSDAPPPPRNS